MKIGVNTFGLGPYLRENEDVVWSKLWNAGIRTIEPCIAFHEVSHMDEAYLEVKNKGIFDGIFSRQSMIERLAVLRNMGFEVVSFQLQETPFAIEEFREVISFMKQTGLRYCIYNFMDQSVEKMRKLETVIKEAVKLFRDNELELLVHNHDMEWYQDGEICVMEWLLEHVPELRFEIDLGWTEYAGIDAVELLKKYAERFAILHIKDIANGKKARTGDPFCVAPGEGILPLDKIIEFATKLPLDEHSLIIDQDDSVCGDIVNDIAKGVERIQKLLPIQKPRIYSISVVAENILLLTIQEGQVGGGVQIPYVPQPEEFLEEDTQIPELVYIVKDGRRIGVKVEDRQKGTQRFPFEHRIGEALDVSKADVVDTYSVNGKQPLCVYRKTKPNNIVDPVKEYTFLHNIYLVCEDVFAPGEKITVELCADIYEQTCIELDFAPETARTEAIHVNQLGYRPDDPSKKAYLSQWMGLGGGICYNNINNFFVIDVEGKKVYQGAVVLNHTGEVVTIGNGEISSLSPVYEMDFSEFRQEGIFRIMIPQLGCSYPVHIGEGITWGKGFKTVMNALYCQRSGIVTGKPYTSFERPRVYHPEDGRVVYQSTCSLFASGNGLNCYGTDVNNFGNLLRGATEEIVENAWGGYFDACDWDRRIQHLNASRLQIELFLMCPEYYYDMKLPIPESGNGIPDILNEARYNIDFYKRLQLPNGGIRGGIEAEEHPILGQCGWQDTWKAYAYAPDFWSSYYYASTAARMAYALKKIDSALSKEYEISAECAFHYAQENYEELKAKEGHKWTRRAHRGVELERENAACDLFRLTQNPEYENTYLMVRTGNNQDANFVYGSLPSNIGDEKIKNICLQAIYKAADDAIENGKALPFHLTSENLTTESVATWGRFCTVPRITQLVRAHYLSKDSKYLKAALAASDFGAGANPENLCFTTGVGVRFPRNILHHDSRMTGQTAPAGITVMGPQDFHHPDDAFPRLLQADFMWPGAYAWPMFEGYLDIYRHPCVNEYTVQGNIGPISYQWGYFAAREEI